MAQKNLSTITINYSLLSTVGGLYQTRDDSGVREIKASMVCPDCENSLLNQVYQCQAGCKPSPKAPGKNADGWTTKEIPGRARVEGKGAAQKLIVLAPDEVAAAKAPSIPPGETSIVVHPAEEWEAVSAPSGSTFVFVPEKADKLFTMFLGAATDTTKAFIGVINLRGIEKPCRFVAHNGTLRVIEYLWPEQTAVFAAAPTTPVLAAEQAVFDELTGLLSDPLDVADYSDSRRANMVNLIASKQGLVGQPAPVLPKPTAKTTTDLDQLNAALALAKAAKAAKKAKVAV